jgi:hypothetical protein
MRVIAYLMIVVGIILIYLTATGKNLSELVPGMDTAKAGG